MAERTLEHDKIEMVWNSVVDAVLPDENGICKGISLKNIQSGETSELPCKGVFIAIGHIPNTAPFKNLLKQDENGYLVPSSGQVKTDIPGVYVAGDCADHVYRQAITAAGMGCQAAIETERWLAEHA